MRTGPLGAFLIAGIWLSGCGWTAKSPEPPWDSSGLVGGGDRAEWWRELGDDALDDQIGEALENSPSFEVLAARVEVGRAQARLIRAASEPTIMATGARRFGERQEFETGGERADVMRYTGLATLAWEIDFWGRVRQLRLGARRHVEASEADEDAGRLLLVGEIARLDFARRRLAAEESVISDTLAANDDTVERLAEKEVAGIIDESAVDRQRAEGDSLRREIEEVRRQRRVSELSLDRLLGRDPGEAAWPQAPPMPDPPKTPEVVKTELLARRPDMRAAAARVADSWHLSQAATLDLLPKLRLGGLAAGKTMQLTPSIDQWVAQVAPTLEIPLWDPDRLAEVKLREAEAYLAAIEFRESVLVAFEEVAVALTNLSAQASIERSARSSAASLSKVYKRTSERFDNGLVSQLEVLEDQRRALQAQRAALRSSEARLSAWVSLREAMGG